jgi:hypothetical protein
LCKVTAGASTTGSRPPLRRRCSSRQSAEASRPATQQQTGQQSRALCVRTLSSVGSCERAGLARDAITRAALLEFVSVAPAGVFETGPWGAETRSAPRWSVWDRPVDVSIASAAPSSGGCPWVCRSCKPETQFRVTAAGSARRRDVVSLDAHQHCGVSAGIAAPQKSASTPPLSTEWRRRSAFSARRTSRWVCEASSDTRNKTAVETDSSGAFLDRPDAEPRATELGCSGDLLGRTRSLARPQR